MHAIGSKETFWSTSPGSKILPFFECRWWWMTHKMVLWCATNPGVSLQGTSIHLQGISIVGIIVGWLFWVFTMDYLCARRWTLASALGKNTFGRRKIRDGRHLFCEWDPVMRNPVPHHSRPQWEQTATISNFALPKRVFGHSQTCLNGCCEQGFVKINVSNASFSTCQALQSKDTYSWTVLTHWLLHFCVIFHFSRRYWPMDCCFFTGSRFTEGGYKALKSRVVHVKYEEKGVTLLWI